MVVALTLVGCAGDGDDSPGDARKGGSIRIAWSAPPDALDPALASTPRSREAVWLAYLAPVTFRRAEGAQGTELVPGLAERLPEVSEDGHTYRFRLRSGLRYSDGQRVSAGDFEHAIKRTLLLNRAAGRLFRGIRGARRFATRRDAGADIPGITANDRTRAVAVELSEPDGRFAMALATTYAGLVPAGAPFEDASARPPPGVGPYALSSAGPGGGFVMRRNRGFRLPGVPEGNLDRVSVHIDPDRSRQAEEVIVGTTDFMQDPPPPSLLPEIRSKYANRYQEHVATTTRVFYLDSRRAPFDDDRVRQAVNRAIGGEELRRLHAGLLEPGCNLLPPAVPGHRNLDPCPYGSRTEDPDLEAARDLVDRAGASGERVSVRSRPGDDPRVVRYYAGTLRKIGLDPAVSRGRARADTGLVELASWLPHPASFLRQVDAAGVRRSVARLASADLESVKDRWAQLDERLVERALAAPYGSPKRSTFVSERLDLENCSRFHPVYGNDYSSFCLR